MDGKEEVVKEVKPNDIVNTIMRAWDGVIESPTKEKFQSFFSTILDTVKKKNSEGMVKTVSCILAAEPPTKLKGPMVN